LDTNLSINESPQKNLANSLSDVDYSDADNQIIHIESIHKSGKMTNVTLYQIDKEFRLVKLTESKSASFIDDEWFLFDVTETSFIFESASQAARISKSSYQKLKWENPLNQDNIDTLTLKHETLNINGLMKYENYLSSNSLDSAEVELSIWQKLLMPISVAIMMFLATSFVFGPMRDVSMGARILSGILLGFGFHLAKQSFGPISLIYDVSPFIGAVIPLLGFTGLSVWLMRKSS
ncbi:MAG: LptF/LptG family permease, partial [Kangiellaceae bacterium]|nr:LptF/LptG family permease [Kangiellaceae bacterium]